ncbi:hypothetical protein CR513_00340, partial [Mucuna pruriens]
MTMPISWICPKNMVAVYERPEFEDKFFSRKESQKDIAQTIGDDFQGPLTKSRLKKLEADIQKNMDLL